MIDIICQLLGGSQQAHCRRHLFFANFSTSQNRLRCLFATTCSVSVFWNSPGVRAKSFVYAGMDMYTMGIQKVALSNAPQAILNHRDSNDCVKLDTVNFTRLFGIRIARGPFGFSF